MKTARELVDSVTMCNECTALVKGRLTAALEARDAEHAKAREGLAKVVPIYAAERDEARAALTVAREQAETANGFIGKARELLWDWLSDAWSQQLADTTSEFFASTDIAYGCEYVDCELPWGHKHVSGGPAQDQKQDIGIGEAVKKSEGTP